MIVELMYLNTKEMGNGCPKSKNAPFQMAGDYFLSGHFRKIMFGIEL